MQQGLDKTRDQRYSLTRNPGTLLLTLLTAGSC